MTALPYSSIDEATDDLLSMLAAHDDDHQATFLAACRTDAAEHNGYVSVLRVRARLAGSDIPPRRLSAMWGHHTGPGRAMVRTAEYEADNGGTTRNGNKLYVVRRWVGAA